MSTEPTPAVASPTEENAPAVPAPIVASKEPGLAARIFGMKGLALANERLNEAALVETALAEAAEAEAAKAAEAPAPKPKRSAKSSRAGKAG